MRLRACLLGARLSQQEYTPSDRAGNTFVILTSTRLHTEMSAVDAQWRDSYKSHHHSPIGSAIARSVMPSACQLWTSVFFFKPQSQMFDYPANGDALFALLVMCFQLLIAIFFETFHNFLDLHPTHVSQQVNQPWSTPANQTLNVRFDAFAERSAEPAKHHPRVVRALTSIPSRARGLSISV